MRKLKFYIIGLIPGLILMFFFLNQKGASCSGYLPNSRVITETLSKDFEYSPQFRAAMVQYKVTEAFLKDSIITLGKINFEQSDAQKQPCPMYYLDAPKKNNQYLIKYEKCKDKAYFIELKKIK